VEPNHNPGQQQAILVTESLVWTPSMPFRAAEEQIELQTQLSESGFVIVSSRPLPGDRGRRLLNVASVQTDATPNALYHSLENYLSRETERQRLSRSDDDTPPHDVDVEGFLPLTTAAAPHALGSNVRLARKVTTLTGTQPNPSTTGGPDGKDSKFPGNAVCDLNITFARDSAREQWLTNALSRVQSEIEAGTRTPNNRVRVFVLDASPYGTRPALLSQRVKDFDNPVVVEFFNELNKSIRLGPDHEFSPTPDVGTSHETDMASHGLFIASIIRMLAPEAIIDIIPIVNANGEGSVERFAQELTETQYLPLQGEQVLINFSATAWVSEISQSDLQAFDIKYGNITLRDLKNLFGTHFIDDDDWKTIHEFGAKNPNRRIIAAAGNQDFTWFPAFPARVAGVLSVGAVTLGGEPTSYSNRPQVPPESERSADLNRYLADRRSNQPIDTDGIQVSLGMRYANGGINYETDRINGLFVKQRFESTLSGSTPVPNDCGLAEWSGTSFATAVATGYMAKLCLAGMTAQEAYDEMLRLPEDDKGFPTLITWQTNV
jgi:hypothetical protein